VQVQQKLQLNFYDSYSCKVTVGCTLVRWVWGRGIV